MNSLQFHFYKNLNLNFDFVKNLLDSLKTNHLFKQIVLYEKGYAYLSKLFFMEKDTLIKVFLFIPEF